MVRVAGYRIQDTGCRMQDVGFVEMVGRADYRENRGAKHFTLAALGKYK